MKFICIENFVADHQHLNAVFFVWINENLKFQYTLRGLDPTYWLAVGLSQKLINNFSMVIIKLFFSSLNC